MLGDIAGDRKMPTEHHGLFWQERGVLGYVALKSLSLSHKHGERM